MRSKSSPALGDLLTSDFCFSPCLFCALLTEVDNCCLFSFKCLNQYHCASLCPMHNLRPLTNSLTLSLYAEGTQRHRHSKQPSSISISRNTACVEQTHIWLVSLLWQFSDWMNYSWGSWPSLTILRKEKVLLNCKPFVSIPSFIYHWFCNMPSNSLDR